MPSCIDPRRVGFYWEVGREAAYAAAHSRAVAFGAFALAMRLNALEAQMPRARRWAPAQPRSEELGWQERGTRHAARFLVICIKKNK